MREEEEEKMSLALCVSAFIRKHYGAHSAKSKKGRKEKKRKKKNFFFFLLTS